MSPKPGESAAALEVGTSPPLESGQFRAMDTGYETHRMPSNPCEVRSHANLNVTHTSNALPANEADVVTGATTGVHERQGMWNKERGVSRLDATLPGGCEFSETARNGRNRHTLPEGMSERQSSYSKQKHRTSSWLASRLDGDNADISGPDNITTYVQHKETPLIRSPW